MEASWEVLALVAPIRIGEIRRFRPGVPRRGPRRYPAFDGTAGRQVSQRAAVMLSVVVVVVSGCNAQAVRHDSYEGEVNEAGQPHGQGVMTSPDGGYEGEFVNGVPHGFGVLTYPDGTRIEGEFRAGQPHGHGIVTSPNGNRYEGEIRAGALHGQGVMTFPDGTRQEWRDGQAHGQGVATPPDGTRYEGEVNEAGQPHGQGVMTLSNGVQYEGEFRGGDWHGRGVFTSPVGTRYEGEFANNQFHGQGVMTFSGGTRIEGEWRDGQAHGQGVATSLDGGYSHVLDVFTYTDGKRYEGEESEAGQPHGQGVFTYTDGGRYEGGWTGSTSTDAMDDTTRSWVRSSWTNPINGLQSYYADLEAIIALDCGDSEPFVVFTEGVLLKNSEAHSGFRSIWLRVRFDDEPMFNVRFLQLIADDDVLFAVGENAKRLYRGILDKRSVMVEIPLFRAGRALFKFELTGSKDIYESHCAGQAGRASHERDRSREEAESSRVRAAKEAADRDEEAVRQASEPEVLRSSPMPMAACRQLAKNMADQFIGRVVVVRDSARYYEFRMLADDGTVSVVCANGRFVSVRH